MSLELYPLRQACFHGILWGVLDLRTGFLRKQICVAESSLYR